MMLNKWRAIARNAAFWAAVWGAACIVAVAAITTFSPERRGQFIAGVFFLTPRFAVWGALTGVIFSAIVSLLCEGRSLRDLSVVAFGVAGGLGTAVAVPLLMQTMHVLTGGGLLAWEDINSDALITGVLGGLSAAATLGLAKFAAHVASDGELETPDHDAISAPTTDLPFTSPSRTPHAQEHR